MTLPPAGPDGERCSDGARRPGPHAEFLLLLLVLALYVVALCLLTTVLVGVMT